MLWLCHRRLDHADAVRLNAELQQEYRVRYGGDDTTPTDPRQFDAPHGLFVVGYVDGAPVACGGWRARGGAGDPDHAHERAGAEPRPVRREAPVLGRS